jgi:hypothetical protein
MASPAARWLGLLVALAGLGQRAEAWRAPSAGRACGATTRALPARRVPLAHAAPSYARQPRPQPAADGAAVVAPVASGGATRARLARALRAARAPVSRRGPRSWARGLAVLCMVAVPQLVRAMGGGGALAADANLNPSTLPVRILLWAVLFVMAACFAAAETAITTLWPWKIKKILAEEGPSSSFSPLQVDISRVLTTLLIGVTICTVYSTALATLIATTLFGVDRLNLVTAALTLFTLIFAEILPKTVAVSKAEAVARISMPIINALSSVLTPVSLVVTGITRVLTTLLRVDDESEEGGAVSQPELKLMLMGAMKSGSIANYEVEMIEVRGRGPLPLLLLRCEVGRKDSRPACME